VPRATPSTGGELAVLAWARLALPVFLRHIVDTEKGLLRAGNVATGHCRVDIRASALLQPKISVGSDVDGGAYSDHREQPMEDLLGLRALAMVPVCRGTRRDMVW
jgi:hypothetical protein